MVHIVTDTTAGLPPAIITQYAITVIPQIVIFDEQSFYEGVELDNAAFMTRLKSSSTLPKTAAPPPDLFVKEFSRLVGDGQPILCIHPSAEVSGTVRSAQVAALDFPQADIRIIDTRLIASPLATLVRLAAEWAAAGRSVDRIQTDLLAMIPRCRVYFLVATLEFLARGGRIGGAAALLGSVLQIKPILTLRDGKVDQYEKERTQRRAIARLKELTFAQINRDGQGYLAVMHAGVPDEAAQLASDLAQPLGLSLDEIPILDVPPAIVTHGGPGILGVSFFT